MTHPMRICAFGSFDKAFDRCWILLEALEQSGADVVLSDTERHGSYFEHVLGVTTRKFQRVFVGAGQAWQQARWSPPTDGPFTVLFYAKFSPLHGIPAIIDAAERLKEENVHFVI